MYWKLVLSGAERLLTESCGHKKTKDKEMQTDLRRHNLAQVVTGNNDET